MYLAAIVAVSLVLIPAAFSSDGLKQVNCTGICQTADINAKMSIVMKLKQKEFEECARARRCPLKLQSRSSAPCIDGKSDEYECSNVDMVSFVSLSDLGSNGNGNDIWGWTDPETNREYALVGCVDGTSFVDVTVAESPVVIGFLPTHTSSSSWRDLKVSRKITS
jgi:hypothetical protein